MNAGQKTSLLFGKEGTTEQPNFLCHPEHPSLLWALWFMTEATDNPCPCPGMFSCRMLDGNLSQGSINVTKTGWQPRLWKDFPKHCGESTWGHTSCLPRKAVCSLPWARAPLLSSTLHFSVHGVEKQVYSQLRDQTSWVQIVAMSPWSLSNLRCLVYKIRIIKVPVL